MAMSYPASPFKRSPSSRHKTPTGSWTHTTLARRLRLHCSRVTCSFQARKLRAGAMGERRGATSVLQLLAKVKSSCSPLLTGAIFLRLPIHQRPISSPRKWYLPLYPPTRERPTGTSYRAPPSGPSPSYRPRTQTGRSTRTSPIPSV